MLREGIGAYTCFPGVEGAPGPMCLDREWMRWADARMNMPRGGASNIDPFATEPTEDNQWVVEGPHLMLILPRAMPHDVGHPSSGSVVMPSSAAASAVAHVMVPVAPRPE